MAYELSQRLSDVRVIRQDIEARFKVSILRGTFYRSEDIINGEISGYDRLNAAVIFIYILFMYVMRIAMKSRCLQA